MVGKKLTRSAITKDHPLGNDGVQDGAALTWDDFHMLYSINILNLKMKVSC